MPSFTSFLNLYKPGGGSTGLITPDEVADIDRLNQNSDLIDAWATKIGNELNRSFLYYGTEAAMGGALVPPPKDGDEYQESDGNKIRWKRVGGVWVTNESGMYLIRPTSVVGGTIQSNGHVVASGTSDTLLVNGVFTSRFKRYRIVFDAVFLGGTNQPILTLSAAGVPSTAAVYYTHIFSQTGATLSGVFQNAYNWTMLSANAGNAQQGSIELSRPAEALDTYIQANVSSPTGGNTVISGYHQPATSYDGFRLAVATVGAGRYYGSQSDFAIYGLT